jgi:hypothetical protein
MPDKQRRRPWDRARSSVDNAVDRPFVRLRRRRDRRFQPNDLGIHFLILTAGCSPSVNCTPADSRVAQIRGPQSSPPLCHRSFPSISKGPSVAPPSSDAIRISYPTFLQKGGFLQPSGFPCAIGEPIASQMARWPKPNRRLCWRPLKQASGHCGSGEIAQTVVIRRRRGAWVKGPKTVNHPHPHWAWRVAVLWLRPGFGMKSAARSG